MLATITLVSALLLSSSTIATPLPSTRSAPPPTRRACAALLPSASALGAKLGDPQVSLPGDSNSYNNHWLDANTFENFFNYDLATNAGADGFGSRAIKSEYDPNYTKDASIFNGSNDDALWAVLMYLKWWDWLQATGQSGSDLNDKIKSTVANIHATVAADWTDTCGGGLLWDHNKDYKNSITNELYLSASAEIYLHWGGDNYLSEAKKAWSWISQSNLRGSSGLYNDGLLGDCGNNNGETWTYNQGVILSGLGALYAATGRSDNSLLEQAEITLDAVIRGENGITTNGVLRETCDDNGGYKCNDDQKMFKGIFVKHLGYYLDRVNDSSRTAKYAPFIAQQADAIKANSLINGGSGGASPVWFEQNSVPTTDVTEPSAMGALITAAKYQDC